MGHGKVPFRAIGTVIVSAVSTLGMSWCAERAASVAQPSRPVSVNQCSGTAGVTPGPSPGTVPPTANLSVSPPTGSSAYGSADGTGPSFYLIAPASFSCSASLAANGGFSMTATDGSTPEPQIGSEFEAGGTGNGDLLLVCPYISTVGTLAASILPGACLRAATTDSITPISTGVPTLFASLVKIPSQTNDPTFSRGSAPFTNDTTAVVLARVDGTAVKTQYSFCGLAGDQQAICSAALELFVSQSLAADSGAGPVTRSTPQSHRRHSHLHRRGHRQSIRWLRHVSTSLSRCRRATQKINRSTLDQPPIIASSSQSKPDMQRALHTMVM